MISPLTSSDFPTDRAEPAPLDREVITAVWKAGLSAQRIYQDLVSDHQFTGHYDAVKRFVRHLGDTHPLPFRRMESEPGQEAQVDYGQGAWVVENGRRRRPHVLRVILSCSRKGYTEVFWQQTTENFIRGLENAFRHFGGVPRTLVIDNLRAAVSKADWFDPELNPKVLAFCEHYQTAVLPTRPAMPRHKGKIERGIGYVKGNALKGHVFASLDEQNQHLLHWEQTVADTRMHGTTRQQVGKRFHEERVALQPLPAARFPCFNEGRRIVHRDGHVEVDKAYYSVPPEYLGRQVWVQWDNHLVRVLNQRQQSIAVHAKRQPGCFSTHNKHIPLEKTSPIEHGAERQLQAGATPGQQLPGQINAAGVQAPIVSAGVTALPLRISRAFSALVPVSRATSGTLMSACFCAASSPFAISSHRVMPPKMLIRMAFTFGSERMMRIAVTIFSGEDDPPTSRKLAGSPSRIVAMSFCEPRSWKRILSS